MTGTPDVIRRDVHSGCAGDDSGGATRRCARRPSASARGVHAIPGRAARCAVRCDATLAQQVAAKPIVVSLVGMQLSGPAARSSVQSGHGRQGHQWRASCSHADWSAIVTPPAATRTGQPAGDACSRFCRDRSDLAWCRYRQGGRTRWPNRGWRVPGRSGRARAFVAIGAGATAPRHRLQSNRQLNCHSEFLWRQVRRCQQSA